jgi:hypothetical protein
VGEVLPHAARTAAGTEYLFLFSSITGPRARRVRAWPGVIPRGKVVREVGSHLGLLPTIAKATGAELPADRTLDGFDALPVVQGEPSRQDAIYWSSGRQLAVRRGKWKLVEDGKTFDGTPDGDKALTGDDALFLSNLRKISPRASICGIASGDHGRTRHHDAAGDCGREEMVIGATAANPRSADLP